VTTSLTRANVRTRRSARTADAPRAAIYCRISDDRRGMALGVERQREYCLALAARNGWRVTDTFTDNDTSAYSGKPRPDYANLMAAVDAGAVDVIVAWDPDRLHRSPSELETFISSVERAGVAVHTVQAGEWDLSTANGCLHARMLAAVARHESEHKSERVRRAMEQNAQAGRSHGRRAYGWTREYAPDGTVSEMIVPAEAAVIRRIADALLSGESLRPSPPG
jgi:site-specific DNA recombinase